MFTFLQSTTKHSTKKVKSNKKCELNLTGLVFIGNNRSFQLFSEIAVISNGLTGKLMN